MLIIVSHKSNLNDLTATTLQNAVLGHPDSWVKSWFLRQDREEICLSAWADAYLTYENIFNIYNTYKALTVWDASD